VRVFARVQGAIVVILVTEDVEDNRELMRLLLEYHGHEVDTAADGAQAIAATARRIPDMIFMDMRMPVMDGFTATRLLREAPETRDVPIIALSAYVNDSTWADRARAAGCNDCMGKPVAYDDLEQVIRRFCR
jgi:CheY-like chemotaxis protein